MKRCQNCGFELPDGMKFCGKCGATQQAQLAYQQPTAPANYKKGRIKRIIIGIESILLLISVFFVPYGSTRIGTLRDSSWITAMRMGASPNFAVISYAVVVFFVVISFKGFFTGKESTFKMFRNISIIGIFAEVILLAVSAGNTGNFAVSATAFITLPIWLVVLITAQLAINEERN